MTQLTNNFLVPFGYGEILHEERVGGGCINDCWRLLLDSGESHFLKVNDHAPVDFFTAESKSLEALAEQSLLRIPSVLLAKENFILMEDLGVGLPNLNYWQTLGEGLASLHSCKNSNFGFLIDNYCGSTLQRNPTIQDGFEFFKEHRLMTLSSEAFDKNLIEEGDLKRIELIASNLTNWIPTQSPVLIHGDLWSGNVHCDRDGNPCLVDPATYWGWAEADLAMTELFGNFNREFYESYESVSDIEKDWRERSPLYNLYHLLNHLILFGPSYLGNIRSVIKRFT